MGNIEFISAEKQRLWGAMEGFRMGDTTGGYFFSKKVYQAG